MEAKAGLVIGALIVVIGVILLLPAWSVARRFAKSRPGSSWAMPITKANGIEAAIVVAVLVAAIALRYLAPASTLGGLLSGWGLVVFAAGTLALSTLANVAVVRHRRQKLVAKLDADPVEAWTSPPLDDPAL